MIKKISNLGDSALYCDFGNDVNQTINSRVIKIFRNLRKNTIKGITNITPSYNKLIISFDLDVINFEQLEEKITQMKIEDFGEVDKRIVKIPVCIDEEFSLDLKRLSEKLKINENEIIKSFLSKEYFCYMTGFIAGMPFLGDLDENMRAQRLETPRVKVPKGSVALTEQFANIYTFESPGGWNILGNTPLDVFDGSIEDKPNLINPGDTVIFKEITLDQYKNYNE